MKSIIRYNRTCSFASNRLNRGLSSSPTLNYTSRNFEKESIFQNWAKIVVVHLLHIGTFTANRHLINSSFLFLSWKFSTRITQGITLKDISLFLGMQHYKNGDVFQWNASYFCTRNQDLWSCSRIPDVALWDEPNIELECQSVPMLQHKEF